MANLTQTAANVALVSSSGTVKWVQVGEAVTQGMPGYQSTSDSKYYQTDANASAATAIAAGIFMTAASTDGYALLVSTGTVNLGATLAVGTIYAVSATKGLICPVADLTTGDYPTTLGIATTTSGLPLNITVSGVAIP